MRSFRADIDWERLPEGVRHADVADVGVDSHDNVYLLTRFDARVIVYDPSGGFLGAWGSDVFSAQPHGLTVGPEDTIYIVDEARHRVEAFSTDGEPRSRIGPAGAGSDTGADPAIDSIYDRVASIRNSAGPYNRPTKLAVAPNGDLYVTDGYGNARVHRFDASGTLLRSWGEPGSGPGQFHLPHSLAVLPDGRVVVCDRENDRLQVFTAAGDFLDEWPDFCRPAGIYHRDGLVYVTELGWRLGHRSWRHGVVSSPRPARLTVLDHDGAVLLRWGSAEPCAPDGFTAPHGVCVDSGGNVYVAEVTWTAGGRKAVFPPGCHSFVRLTPAMSSG